MNGSKKEDLVLYKDYPLEDKQGLPELPVLEIWPNFTAPNWKTYYGFYFDGEYGANTFQIGFPGAKEQQPFTEGSGTYLLARFEEFPRYLECQNRSGALVGLVLLPTPKLVQPRKHWKVGVDFGTSFTNIYVNGSQGGEEGIYPLKVDKLHWQVTQSDPETRLPVLFEYFIPEEFVPATKPFPLCSVLTTRGSTIKATSVQNKDSIRRPLFDGRIFVPADTSQKGFNPSAEWIKTNLKWSAENRDYNHTFLSNLMLYISAIAAKSEVESIAWSLSYPSAFSKTETGGYVRAWKQISEMLTPVTGINHSVPTRGDKERFRTESLAVAQFFADFNDSPQQDLIHTTCIDVGGGTSDISIWQGNTLVHQCSVQLAGRDLFSQFLLADGMKFLNEHLLGGNGWSNVKGYGFNAKLDVWLRLQSDNWLRVHRDILEENEKFIGFIRLMAIGYAGLFYYNGILLKTLFDEKKLSRAEITPVCLGGNASRFLHWLVEGGYFDDQCDTRFLLSRMLSQGSWFKCSESLNLSQKELHDRYYDFEEEERGFKDIKVDVFLSPNPKDEVAFGLVLDQTSLKGLDRDDEDELIAGERYKVGKVEKSPGTRFVLDSEEIKTFDIPALPELQRFLYVFHAALKELRVEQITPLPKTLYTPSLDPKVNEDLWRTTNRRLDNMILNNRQQKSAEDVRFEPPFIMGLKALLVVLGEEWAKMK